MSIVQRGNPAMFQGPEYVAVMAFTLPPSPNDISVAAWALHQEMAKWFDANPNVERYAPFGAMRRKF
jgi:hypothetical protein